jgi:hypothetical protein
VVDSFTLDETDQLVPFQDSMRALLAAPTAMQNVGDTQETEFSVLLVPMEP